MLELLRSAGWLRLHRLLSRRGVKPLALGGYAWLARHRHRLAALWRWPMPLGLGGLLLGLGLGALSEGFWMRMGSAAGGLWLFLKCVSWSQAVRQGENRFLLSYLAWPGMDPRPFLKPGHRPRMPAPSLMAIALNFTAATGCLAAAAALPPTVQPWLGMAALVFLLHFVLFHLCTRMYRRQGFPVDRLMHAPWLSGSLAEFWGRRWNVAFRDAFAGFYHQVSRAWGRGPAVASVFLISGFLHELVISWPVRQGYGGPTLYFLVQAAGWLAEDRWGRNAPPLLRRLWTWLLLLAPLGWLFHAPFREAVVNPWLKGLTQ